ncbi:MAG: hypothetical protein LUF04_00715, partial [Bacteroides sp.]|nr:hypothetical protein [Bacteroides sp.]
PHGSARRGVNTEICTPAYNQQDLTSYPTLENYSTHSGVEDRGWITTPSRYARLRFTGGY